MLTPFIISLSRGCRCLKKFHFFSNLKSKRLVTHVEYTLSILHRCILQLTGTPNNQIIAQMKCVMSIKTLIEETGFRQSLVEQIEYWPKFHFRNNASPDCVTFEMGIQLNRILNQRLIEISNEEF